LRVHESPFLRIEILLALLAVPLLTASCGPRQVWGIPVDELRGQLAKGAYTSLAPVDFSAQDPRDALSLSPEAPYYLSFVFAAMGKPLPSQRMLELAWERSPSPWKEEAGVLLAEQENGQKDYAKTIEIARRLLGANIPVDLQQRARRALVEALYWTKEDAAALGEADRLASPDAEVLLFRAVSSLRLDLPQAHDLMMRLFTSEKVSALHGRAYTFLSAEPAYLQLFSAREQDLLAAKNALVQGDWAKGIPLMETVLGGADPAQVSDGILVLDLGSSYGYAGRQAAGARFLERLAAGLVGQARTDALEQAGRLYRRLKDAPHALPLLRAAAEQAAAPVQRDRVRWLILDMLVAANRPGLTRQIAEETASWSDPGYFSDRLESWIADLVTARKWDTLSGLWSALGESGPDDVRAQLSYLLARAWQEGEVARLPGDPRSTARDLFLDAARRDEAGYYGILSASILGQVPDRSMPAPEAAQEPGGQQPAAGAALDPLVMGFLPYGLSALAYTRLWTVRDSLGDGQLVEAAKRFARAGDTRSSMYLVGVVGRRRRLTEPELELYYPKAFADLIDPLAARARIPDHILYALVREESYFDADIVSSAGAVGLSQLMPSTAAAVAKGLQMNDPDLRDPATNLAIGVRHLQDLLSSVDSPTKALLSYNAGLKRLRQWERAARGFPVDLFVESVPIAETRGYVRKILVSAVMYASLYADADPREAALSFLNIEKKSLDTAGPRGLRSR
jgi:soluble lytic murein transglycosylase